MPDFIQFMGETVDVDQGFLELERMKCEESLSIFLQHAWKHIDPAPFVGGWVIDAVAEHLEAVCDGDIRRLLIHIPPRSSKSSIISVAFPAWVWAQRREGPISGPRVPFLHASYAFTLSLRDSIKCRRLLQSNWYQRLWGDRFQLSDDTNRAVRFGNTKGGERLITSIGAGVTGEGGNCFMAGTAITMPSRMYESPFHYRSIEYVEVGETVISADPLTGRLVEDKVVAVQKKENCKIVELKTISNRHIYCTPDHRFWSPSRGGWSAASYLQNGDIVFGQTHDHVVASVEERSPSVAVYDLQTERYHNFFAEQMLVHNCIIIDDPNAANEVLSEAVIKTTNEDWWDGTMSTRLNDPKTGAFVVVQQRLGEEDLSGHILSKDKGEWTHLMLPMRYEPNRSFVTSIGWKDPRTQEGELLWPERFGEQEIRTLESDLGKWRASGQLQQRPEPAGGGIIKREWWNLWPPEGEPLDANGKPTRIVQFPAFDFIIASLDTAYTEKTMNDPSALSIWGVFSGDTVAHEVKLDEAGNTTRAYVETSTRIMLIHCWSEHLELHPLVQKVAKSCGPVVKGGFNVDKLLIEDKAAGHSVAQELRRLFSNEPYSIQLINPKAADKMARLYSVQNLWEKGMIYAPDRPWSEMMIAQCGTFPNAKHDDLVDTASMALRHMRDIGLLIHGDERQAEAEESMRYRGRPLAPLYPV